MLDRLFGNITAPGTTTQALNVADQALDRQQGLRGILGGDMSDRQYQFLQDLVMSAIGQGANGSPLAAMLTPMAGAMIGNNAMKRNEAWQEKQKKEKPKPRASSGKAPASPAPRMFGRFNHQGYMAGYTNDGRVKLYEDENGKPVPWDAGAAASGVVSTPAAPRTLSEELEALGPNPFGTPQKM